MKEKVTENSRILIIDDEPFVRNILCDILREHYSCETAASAEEALQILEREEFDLVLSDINMPGMSGLEMVPQIIKSSPDTVIMVISGEGNIESAIEAMQAGTFDYIKKPFELETVKIAVERALNHHFLLAEKRRYENHLEELVKERTDRLNFLAYHDSLTSLPNRTLFEDRLAQALPLAAQNKQNVATIFLSLNRFKKIQETLGHNFGFRILQEVAARLKDQVPPGATVARFENDEFALLLPRIGVTDQIIEIVENIKETLKSPVVLDEHEIFVSASVGISLFPDDGEDAQTLQKNAAVALSRAKEQGEYGAQFYTQEMNARALRRLDLENKLGRAVERREFEICYQAKKDFVTDKITGMEALVRWAHPDLGRISPAEFIPLAEETGLIVQIGEWILETVCRQVKLLQDEGINLRVSVNLSIRQFEEKCLAEKIISILEETGLDPQNLELEVTESLIMRNVESAIQTLNEIRKSGVRISIDDFGTGYSSLGYLKVLPIDILKIDKSFVQDITRDPRDAALVRAIISLAYNLGLKIIAEGVETDDQLQMLAQLRCDEWQGYLLSKPVPFDEFLELSIENKDVLRKIRSESLKVNKKVQT